MKKPNLSILALISVCTFIIGCTPNKDSADKFGIKLSCGMSYNSIKNQDEVLRASKINLEGDMLDISFDFEHFVIYLNKESNLIGVDRMLFDYFPFMEGGEYSTKGFATLIHCK